MIIIIRIRQIKMSNETEELRKEIAKLSLKLDALEAKEAEMWVVPNGNFFINGSGRTDRQRGYDEYTKYGVTRNSKAELEDLRQKQEFLNISHNFACANDGVQEFVDGEDNWCVNKLRGDFRADSYFNIQELSTAYMTEKDAKEFARLCKAGLIPFQYQG